MKKIFKGSGKQSDQRREGVRYQIIIPNWNQAELCCNCLVSISRYSRNYEVIFVDNGSEISEFDKIYEVLRTMPHILIRNVKNLGFVKAVNQGMCMVTAPYFVIQNNDTEVVPGWLDKLEEPLTGTVMISGPRTTTVNSWQGRANPGEGSVVLPKTAMVAFFCTMLKSEVIGRVGYLDECFGLGFGDDDDYCLRTHDAGFDIALVQDLCIPHYHRSTFKKMFTDEEIAEQQRLALDKFRKKHNISQYSANPHKNR